MLRYTTHTTLHYITLHYANLTTLHDTTTTTTLRYTNYITLQLQLNDTTLQLQLQRQLQLQLHYTTLHPAVVVRWPLQPLQPLQKAQLQPPAGPSVDSLCHPWFTTTSPSYRFHILETSATALCGTTGMTITWCISIYIYIIIMIIIIVIVMIIRLHIFVQPQISCCCFYSIPYCIRLYPSNAIIISQYYYQTAWFASNIILYHNLCHLPYTKLLTAIR